MRPKVIGLAIPILALLSAGPASSQIVYYSNDFDGAEMHHPGVSGGFSGAGSVVGVQGYGALAPAFDGDFLRNIEPGDPAPESTLTLSGLPPEIPVVVRFSLAIIDSWDGTFFPPDETQSPDNFSVAVNGSPVFTETFTNLSGEGATQSYMGPALAQEVALGFESGPFRLDSAYVLEIDGAADTAGEQTIDFFASGPGWHAASMEAGPEEESWAIDNVVVQRLVPDVPLATPTAWLLAGLLLAAGAGLLAWIRSDPNRPAVSR